MKLILSQNVCNTIVDGYFHNEDAYFTRKQIGELLEYNAPERSIELIHSRHKERLDQFSKIEKVNVDGQMREMYFYSWEGVFEICRWSTQPNADAVMDALYKITKEVIRKGYFSIIPDQDLIKLLTERQKMIPTYITDLVSAQKTLAKKEKEANREAGVEKCRELWVRYFGNKEDIDVLKELKIIFPHDIAMYHKYRDKYWRDYNKTLKGNSVITF